MFGGVLIRSCATVVAFALAVVVFAADIVVFGPQTYTSNGRPFLTQRTFSITAGGDGFLLRVRNNGVILGLVALNEQIVVRPRDLGAAFPDQPNVSWRSLWDRLNREKTTEGATFVPLVEKPVVLRNGQNSIAVAFIAPRGSSLTVEIVKPEGADTTPPLISSTVSPPPNANGWNRTPVTVTFTCTDVGSGVRTCPPAFIVSSEGRNQVFSVTAVDNAGNQATITVALNIDLTAPTVTATRSPDANQNGWNNAPVVVSFAADDGLSGVATGSVTAPATLTTDGANLSATGQASDLAGNVGVVTLSGINIDQVPPGGTAVLSPPANGSGWNNTPITARFTCTDVASGVATCPADATVSSEGSNQIATGTVTDRAGNSAPVSSPLFSIDSTPPSIAVTLSGTTNTSGVFTTPVTARFTCADALSGVGLCPPEQLFSAAGGNLVATGIATDLAGNSATATSLPFTIQLGATISGFSPASGPSGTLVTIAGNGLAPNPSVTLNRQGGGTIDAQVASASASTLMFVIPPGAATGNITVTVGGSPVVSASPLTITTSTDFTLEVTPSAANLIGGQTVTLAVSLTSSSGFTQLATLGVTGVPAGASASFNPTRVTAGQTSLLTLTAPAGQSPASSTLTITASAVVEGLTRIETATAELNVSVPTTSLIGRIVVADTFQTPIAGVTVTLLGRNGNGGTTNCSGNTASDSAGNFALTGLGPECVGPQLVGYNGLTATSPEGDYAGVNLVYTLAADQVTASPVLVHLPRIDDKETFLVQQNASTNQSYNYRTIPGLSVTVYAGTTFRLEDGSAPNPFPLVAVQVPVDRLPDAKPPVPTMLSAFIVAFQPANAVASRPAAVFYPNTLNTQPGVNMTLMTLDPTLGRMVPYGTATVSPDGRHIAPDADPSRPGARYGIVNFDWHGPMPPPEPPQPERPPVNPPPSDEPFPESCPLSPSVGQPCDVSSGLETMKVTDINIKGPRGALSVVRMYRTLSNNQGPFGIGTGHNFAYFLSPNAPQNALLVNLILPQGNWLPFSRSSLAEPLVNDTSPVLRGVVMTTFPDGHAEVRWKDGTVYRFAASSALIVPALESITDRNGNQTTLTRNSARPREITQITDPVGRSLTLTYDGTSRITSIQDPIGRRVQYTYNPRGTLETVTDPEGGVTTYEYDGENRLIRETNARGIVVAQNTYEAFGRVAQQIQADGGVYRFNYTYLNPTVASSPILMSIVTDPIGRAKSYRFTPEGLLTDQRDSVGRVFVFQRDATAANQMTSYQGPSSTAGYEYDARGNILRTTDALGRATIYAYEPQFNGVASITNALSETTTFGYDGRGNLLSQTDAAGRTTTYTYDAFGQLVESTDALGGRTRFAYDSFGNLTRMTDALGNATQFRYDAVSRLVEVVDSLGRRTTTSYDRLDREVSQTDANGRVTQFSYDAVGNMTALTDARGKTTTFTYDPMNRLRTRTDPVGRTDTRTHDLNGNMVSFTDRRGLTSTFVYDQLDRLLEERYADALVTRSYDVDSRLSHVNDSAAGSFSFAYDLTGAVVSSHGPTGSVTYVRDALGRVLQRQVVGQRPVDYAYDAVGNVASASMPLASVTYAYDALNRPLSLTRVNGVRTDHFYDPVGRLVSIVHSRGTSSLFSLAYSYDPGGGRVSQQTSSGQPLVTLPATATYDDADRLIQRGSTSFTYDPNGNLESENAPTGRTTYVWDARNRLTRVAAQNGQAAHFTYDHSGNMIRQSDIGPGMNLTRSYTLDFLTNVAFEQTSNGDQVSVLTSAAIDTHLAIHRSTGDVEYALVDAINSTVSTVDLSGAVQGRFFYSPYGETTSSGSSFSFQYTGRVQVSSALYYYRARFYSPVTGRFISEDPIGFSGGTANLYEYTGSSPTQFTDPLGLRPQCPGCDLVGPDNACTRPCCKAHDECFSANNCAMWSRFGGSEECRQCNAEVDRCLVPCGPMHPELRFNWPPWRDRRRRSTNTEAQSINPILRLR